MTQTNYFRRSIIEIKVAPKYAELEKYCGLALQQIEEKKYEAELREDCYKNILKYGIAFNNKDCLVKLVNSSYTK